MLSNQKHIGATLILLVLCMTFFSYSRRPADPVIHLIGDSTMADRSEPLNLNPERGWGQSLSEFFINPVIVRNHAVNGRSTKSFINEGRWDKVLSEVNPGDYMLIQFGHNDQKFKDPSRYTNPVSGYYYNLKKFIDDSRAKHVIPVLLTSIVRRKFNEFGTLRDTHGLYPLIVRQLARDEDVLFIDHHYYTEKLVQELGDEESKELYNWVTPGQYDRYPNGRKDDTHLSAEGAMRFAGIVAHELVSLDSALYRYYKPL